MLSSGSLCCLCLFLPQPLAASASDKVYALPLSRLLALDAAALSRMILALYAASASPLPLPSLFIALSRSDLLLPLLPLDAASRSACVSLVCVMSMSSPVGSDMCLSRRMSPRLRLRHANEPRARALCDCNILD